MTQILPGIYRHFKCNKYEIIGFSKHSCTLEENDYAGLRFSEANGSLLSAALTKKKPGIDTDKARLVKYTEGLCVQVMHIGSYDDEPATIAAMDKFATDNGYAIDIYETRWHHEIYLSDPCKTAPEKLKTVIRHPIKMIEDDA